MRVGVSSANAVTSIPATISANSPSSDASGLLSTNSTIALVASDAEPSMLVVTTNGGVPRGTPCPAADMEAAAMSNDVAPRRNRCSTLQ